jgi:hypothetical protein
MDYGAARQRCPTGFGVGAAGAGAIADDVDEESLLSVTVAGVVEVFSIVAVVADGVFEGIVGVGGVAGGTRFVTVAFGEVEDVHAVSVWFGFAFVGGQGLRWGTIGHDRRRVEGRGTRGEG